MKNILVTDDEKSFLVSLKEGLGGDIGPYRIFTAENGQQAVEVMESETVDLLITDLRMPVMDGFELLAWVSTNRAELPVIILTAFGNAEVEAKLEQYNTFRFLEKPIDFSMMRDLVETALEDSTISNIHGVTLSSFLQLMGFEKKSCTLIIKSEGRTGNLYLLNGEFINANCGDRQGMDAALEILGWDNASIEMDHVCRNEDVLITNGIESILLEAHRLKDEERGEDAGQADEAEKPDSPITELDDAIVGDIAGDEAGMEQPFGDDFTGIDGGETVSDQIKEMLVKQIYDHVATEECCFFNHQNLLESSQAEATCAQVEFDPAIFLYLTGQLEDVFEFGTMKWINFVTASRNHYLFFKLVGCSLLIKLTKGARPQLLGNEYMDIVNTVMQEN